jgi:tetratricopeptide (TPR) repeat protein
VKNSSLAGYEQYVLAAADGRIEDAKAFLLEALRDARAKGARPVVAGLIQRLGSLMFAGGDRNSALALYEVSLDLDEGSLLAKLEYAKFLWHEMGEAVLAREKCLEVIQAASSNPFPESDDDFGSDEYAEAANRLLNEIGA